MIMRKENCVILEEWGQENIIIVEIFVGNVCDFGVI